ncbi:MAG: flavin reductase family protein [Candidatus Eremiobacteraeota bacterium]|nr:flavin reductase family protein [Candidatus Eremiobacteraeota bacterium]
MMRRFPTGVTVVTTIVNDSPKGFTANAFSSVSAAPPMVLVCVNRQARSHPLIAAAGHFCVNILRLEQQRIAERFASRDGDDPFLSLRYETARTGSPVITDSLAYLDCELAEEHSAGTHTIFLGTVLACAANDGSPLGYFNATYRDFQCKIP